MTKAVSIQEFFKGVDLPAGSGLVASNGEELTYDDGGRLKDKAGRYGYSTHFAGAYVCYTCGHLCECGGE
jgi:hypothetical protein